MRAAAIWSRASVWAATMSSPIGPAGPPVLSRRRHRAPGKTTGSADASQPPRLRLTRFTGSGQLWPCLLVFSSAADVRCAEPSVPPATRTPRCPFSPAPSSPTARWSSTTSPASATSRPCSRCSSISARRSSGPAPTRCGSTPAGAAQAARSRALRPDPRVDPPRRSAARALRDGDPAAARRRRHRPPPGRYPLPGARAAGRRRSRSATATSSRPKALTGADIFLDEPSVTGTENALMAAVAAKGRTVLRNAACEPHVQDLARVLVAMGAADRRASAPTSTRSRAAARSRGASYAIGPDHIEIGSFIGLAAVTNGEITIDPVRPDDLRSTLLGFERLGIRPRVDGTAAHRRRRPGAAHPPRPRRPRAQARGRPVAGVSRPTSCPPPSSPRRSAPACCSSSRRCSSRGSSSWTS